MYLKKKWIAVLKIKNFLFAFLGIFLNVMMVLDLVTLWEQYGDDPETVYNIILYNMDRILFAIAIVVICFLSRKLIGDANMYNSYFELNLDGYITYEELAWVTGKFIFTVKLDMYLIMKIYMKRYKIGSDGKNKRIELYSKTSKCYCTSCGAQIDKRIYFTGICSYCGSSDLFAGVISDGQYYSITSDFGKKKREKSFYLGKFFRGKAIGVFLGVVFNVVMLIMSGCMIFDYTLKFYDEEYWKQVISQNPHQYTVEIVRQDLMDHIQSSQIVFGATLIASVIFYRRYRSVRVSRALSEIFTKVGKPILPISELNRTLGISAKVKKTRKKMKIALRRGYLRNSTLEYHNHTIEVALAKKIVKDRCPNCGASIVGAVDMNYICTYCGNEIMDVVVKK